MGEDSEAARPVDVSDAGEHQLRSVGVVERGVDGGDLQQAPVGRESA